MWTPGYWESSPWSFWWIFPLIGMLVCLTFFVMMVRVMVTGRGAMCMGGHRGTERDEAAELRREIRALREEVAQLRAAPPRS
jgi:hypothetical protein